MPFVPPQIMLKQIYKIMLWDTVRKIIGANFHWQRIYNSTISLQNSDTLACFLSYQQWNQLSDPLHGAVAICFPEGYGFSQPACILLIVYNCESESAAWKERKRHVRESLIGNWCYLNSSRRSVFHIQLLLINGKGFLLW